MRETAEASQAPRPRRNITTAFVVSRIAVLAVAAAILLYAAPPLVATGSWIGLAVLLGATAVIGYLYLTRRYVPAKYLVPGTVFLIAFQVFPVLYTVTTAFTNFGDGHRGDKAAAITAIERGSVRQAPGSPEYQLTTALRGGELVFLLADPATKQVRLGDAGGLSPLPGAEVGVTGKVLRAPGVTVLTAPQAAARGEEIAALTVPTDGGAIKANGLSRAVEGRAALVYDAGCDCMRGEGGPWRADGSQGYFVNAAERAPGPGLAGQRRPGQLRQGADQPHDLRLLPRRVRLERGLRAGLRSRHVRARHGRRAGPAPPAHARHQGLPDRAHPAVRHAVVRDAAGLA
ncbi:hypothetical protein ACFSTC_33275 [Nonomuraea ferruginea]